MRSIESTRRVVRRRDLDRCTDRTRRAAMVHEPGAAILEGWSDEQPWSIVLPRPAESVALPWNRAEAWPAFLRSIERATPSGDPMPEAPFLGGWVGFVAYDAGAVLEAATPPTLLPVEPAAWFARHESGLLVNPSGEVWVFGDESVIEEAVESSAHEPPSSADASVPSRVRDSMEDGRYEAGVDAIRDAIRNGDVYQVNLTRQFDVDALLDPASFYLELTGAEPPLCSVLLTGDEWSIASASPELFLAFDRVTGVAESRPIKGTIVRTADDAAATSALLASDKDASEHLMIVDLVRNDLGKVAPPGRVSVPAFRTVRTLTYVHHLESTVRAEGLAGTDLADVMVALFPGGSITGAPKRAAVRAIRELEPVPRGVYTGALGFIDDRGRSRFSVAIRTAIVTKGHARYHAGGGIVWDSDRAAEDAEAIAKARPFLAQFTSEGRSG